MFFDAFKCLDRLNFIICEPDFYFLVSKKLLKYWKSSKKRINDFYWKL